MPAIVHRCGWISPLAPGGSLDVLFPGKEIRDTLLDRVGNPTGIAIQTAFEYLGFILFHDGEIQITLAGRTAEDGEQ